MSKPYGMPNQRATQGSDKTNNKNCVFHNCIIKNAFIFFSVLSRGLCFVLMNGTYLVVRRKQKKENRKIAHTLRV